MEFWPPLAWVAELNRTVSDMRVFHGSGIETCSKWFVEGVWNETFTKGDFDRTDLVFGSGARIRGEDVIFVSSGTTVDRLHKISIREKTYISNTLPGLLAHLDLPATLRGYTEAVNTIVGGIDQDNPVFYAGSKKVELLYFYNWIWSDNTIRRRNKPFTSRQFSSYYEYIRFIEGSIKCITLNAKSPARKTKYRLLGSISSGYDSATASALAKNPALPLFLRSQKRAML
jgi:hypothetical protein